MRRGTERGTNKLDPAPFIELVELYLSRDKLDEVLIRRFISGLYYCIFNYWGLKKYLANKRGGGSRQDKFSLDDLYCDLLSKNMDKKLIILLYYRVAADHHVLNPTIAEVYISKTRHFPKKEVYLTRNALEKAYKITMEIIEKLN